MDELSEKRLKIEELKKELERYKMSSSFLEAKEEIKKHQKRACIYGALFPFLAIFSLKVTDHGYPFYVDNVNHYKVSETTMDENGNIEEIKETDSEIDLDISKIMGIEAKIDKQNYLYNYFPLNQTITEESIRYIEKYSVGDLTAEEVANLLAKNELNSLGDSKINSYTYGSEKIPTNAHYMLKTTDFSIDKESSKRNRFASLTFIFEILIGEALIAIVNAKSFDKKRAKKLVSEYNLMIGQLEVMINQLEEECDKLKRGLR